MQAEQAPPNKIMAAQGMIPDDDDESDDEDFEGEEDDSGSD